MQALKFERVDENIVRALIFDVAEDGSRALIDNIFESSKGVDWSLVATVQEHYPNLNAVYLGGDKDSRERPGVTLFGNHAVLIPDACDIWCLAEAELKTPQEEI